MDEDVKELIGGLADEMRRGFAKVDDEMRRGFAKVYDEMHSGFARADARLDEKFEETKRHFGVLADDLRGQIRAAAEGDAVTKRENAERFDSLSSEIAEIKSMIPISFTQLDGRIRSLETDNADLHSRVERLESAAH
ncbi:MAG: hypothetical protein JWO97_1705 [Acidobacteria bacterium]|nr:hypothetical protein [Acidobacteriota bacterium]